VIKFAHSSVPNLVTKGIQGMQSVPNLLISDWLPAADLNGGKTAGAAAGSQALIGRFETDCIP